ncbi:MAG: N-acetyltransferase [Clostridia bacterium]|nr:N-acetyltransferase [Clostridia bacterium]
MDTTGKITIRTATPEDARALVAIYAPYVLETGITFEYDVPTEEEFRRRIEGVLRRYPYLVAEREGGLLGYSYANPLGERAAFSRAAETVLYVRRDARGLGIGTSLYRRLEEILRRQNVTNVNACIAWRDEEDETLTHASPAFHAAAGYRKIAHFTACGYKFGRWYDLIWMEKFIGEHVDAPPAFIPFPSLEAD